MTPNVAFTPAGRDQAVPVRGPLAQARGDDGPVLPGRRQPRVAAWLEALRRGLHDPALRMRRVALGLRDGLAQGASGRRRRRGPPPPTGTWTPGPSPGSRRGGSSNGSAAGSPSAGAASGFIPCRGGWPEARGPPFLAGPWLSGPSPAVAARGPPRPGAPWLPGPPPASARRERPRRGARPLRRRRNPRALAAAVRERAVKWAGSRRGPFRPTPPGPNPCSGHAEVPMKPRRQAQRIPAQRRGRRRAGPPPGARRMACAALLSCAAMLAACGGGAARRRRRRG